MNYLLKRKFHSKIFFPDQSTGMLGNIGFRVHVNLRILQCADVKTRRNIQLTFNKYKSNYEQFVKLVKN